MGTLRPLSIAIIGSSLSGILTASVLSKLGFKNLHIFDRSSSWSALTQNCKKPLLVPVNGTHLMNKFLLKPYQKELENQSIRLPTWIQCNKRLQTIDKYSPNTLLKFKTQSQSISIENSTLLDILSSSLSSNVKKHFQVTVNGMKPLVSSKSNYPQFSLELNQKNIIDKNDNKFDLIVGADGERSTIRTLVFGPNRHLRTYGGLLIDGLAPYEPSIDLDVSESITEVWSNGIRIGLFPVLVNAQFGDSYVAT